MSLEAEAAEKERRAIQKRQLDEQEAQRKYSVNLKAIEIAQTKYPEADVLVKAKEVKAFLNS